VGGGGVIDAGKLLAFNRTLPFVTVPTAPSHDGIASDRARLTDSGPAYTVRAKMPNVIIADLAAIVAVQLLHSRAVVLAGADAPGNLPGRGAADLLAPIRAGVPKSSAKSNQSLMLYCLKR